MRNVELQIDPPSNRLIRDERGEYETESSPGWIKLGFAFRDTTLSKLKGCKLSVFLCICLHVGADGTSRPGVDCIARETGYERHAVIRAIKELERIPGLMKITRKRGGINKYQPAYVSYGKRNPTSEQNVPPTSEQNVPPPVNNALTRRRVLRRTKEAEPVAPRPPIGLSEVVTTYENNFGMATPIIRDSLVDALKDYPPGWIVEAMGVAVKAGVRRWNYVDKILARWKIEGFKSNGNGHRRNGRQETDWSSIDVDEMNRKLAAGEI